MIIIWSCKIDLIFNAPVQKVPSSTFRSHVVTRPAENMRQILVCCHGRRARFLERLFKNCTSTSVICVPYLLN